MKRFFRHFAIAAFGVSILCLALGIAMLIWTATAMKWISYGFGAVMILSGILQIASHKARNAPQSFHLLIAPAKRYFLLFILQVPRHIRCPLIPVQ